LDPAAHSLACSAFTQRQEGDAKLDFDDRHFEPKKQVLLHVRLLPGELMQARQLARFDLLGSTFIVGLVANQERENSACLC
jgi:hypothetical protein